MTLNQRKEAHLGLLKAIITGAIAIDSDLHAETCAKYCIKLADAALAEYEKRWEVEDKAENKRGEAYLEAMAQHNIESIRIREESDAFHQARRRAMGIPC